MRNSGCGVIAAIIGLIASIIGIYVFATGQETWADVVDSFGLGGEAENSIDRRSNIPVSEPETIITQTVTLDMPLEELLHGFATIEVDEENSNQQIVGWNFKQNEYSSNTVPADIAFTDCDSYFLDCDFKGSYIKPLGQTALDEVMRRPAEHFLLSGDYDSCSGGCTSKECRSCTIDIGSTYILTTYDGHIAKFKISNVDIVRSDYGPPLRFEFSFEWYYQPNDRDDFKGP